MTTESSDGPLPCWCDISFLGHVHFLAYVSEVEVAGVKLLKVEPISPRDGAPGRVSYWPPASLYNLEPRPEEELRAEIETRRQAEIRRQQMYGPRMIEEARPVEDDPYDDGEDDEEEISL